MHPEKFFPKEFESGRASLEFLVLSISLFVPVLYLGLSLSSLQGASLATEAGARNAVRVYVLGAAEANPAHQSFESCATWHACAARKSPTAHKARSRQRGRKKGGRR